MDLGPSSYDDHVYHNCQRIGKLTARPVIQKKTPPHVLSPPVLTPSPSHGVLLLFFSSQFMTNEQTKSGMRSANASDGTIGGAGGAGAAKTSSKSGAAPRAAQHSGVAGKAAEASWPQSGKGGSVGVGKGGVPLNSAVGTYGIGGGTTPDDSGSGASFGAILAAVAKTKPKAKSKGPMGRGRPGRPVKSSRFRGVTKTSGSSWGAKYSSKRESRCRGGVGGWGARARGGGRVYSGVCGRLRRV